jgi:uncharacterized membrane protein
MSIKLPKNFFRWLIIAGICFVVGFIVAQLFMTPTAVVIEGGESVSGDGQSPPEQVLKKSEPSYLGILIALSIIAALIGFGYYRERRKNK